MFLINKIMKKGKMQIGIIGPERKNLPKNKGEQRKILKLAGEIGRGVAKEKAILITGGCSGVVAAASKAAYQNGGIVVGTPGRERGTAIPWTTVEICTPIDIGDYLFAGVLSCDAIIVIPGDAGTLAELAIAYRNRKPLIFIKGFQEDILEKLEFNKRKTYPYFIVNSAKEAVKSALKVAKR